MELRNKVFGIISAAALTLSMGAAVVSADSIPTSADLDDGACVATIVGGSDLDFNYTWDSGTNTYVADAADRTGTVDIAVDGPRVYGFGPVPLCDVDVALEDGQLDHEGGVFSIQQNRLDASVPGQNGTDGNPWGGALATDFSLQALGDASPHTMTLVGDNNLEAYHIGGLYSGTLLVTVPLAP